MVRGTSHHAPIRQDAKAVPFTFLLINRTSLGSFYLRLFAFVHVCALHIGVVALVAAQAPSAEDYTVAACDANSRADAIARCEQRWPAGALPPRHAIYIRANGVFEERCLWVLPRGFWPLC